MKRYFTVLAAIVLMLGIACVHDATADTTMYVHVSDDSHLNGRRSPTRDSAIEMRLHAGDAVTVCGMDGGWAQIKGGEAGTCWCSVAYLADYPPGETAQLCTVSSDGRVRVRRSPNGETLRYVCDGDTVEVRFAVDGWAYLGDGYVMTEFLERRED